MLFCSTFFFAKMFESLKPKRGKEVWNFRTAIVPLSFFCFSCVCMHVGKNWSAWWTFINLRNSNWLDCLAEDCENCPRVSTTCHLHLINIDCWNASEQATWKQIYWYCLSVGVFRLIYISEFVINHTCRFNLTSMGNILLPLGAEPFVFQSAIQKFKDQDI